MCWIYPHFGRQAPDPDGGMEHLVIDRTLLPLVWSSAALGDMFMLTRLGFEEGSEEQWPMLLSTGPRPRSVRAYFP
jgi:hypothetical protein